MSEQDASASGPVVKAEIYFELPHSSRGTYQHQLPDGGRVHGDASGEWMVDEDGELEDIVFFISPSWTRR